MMGLSPLAWRVPMQQASPTAAAAPVRFGFKVEWMKPDPEDKDTHYSGKFAAELRTPDEMRPGHVDCRLWTRVPGKAPQWFRLVPETVNEVRALQQAFAFPPPDKGRKFFKTEAIFVIRQNAARIRKSLTDYWSANKVGDTHGLLTDTLWFRVFNVTTQQDILQHHLKSGQNLRDKIDPGKTFFATLAEALSLQQLRDSRSSGYESVRATVLGASEQVKKAWRGLPSAWQRSLIPETPQGVTTPSGVLQQSPLF